MRNTRPLNSLSCLNGKKLVGFDWMFVVKHKVDGFIERYKAGLVAKGMAKGIIDVWS